MTLVGNEDTKKNDSNVEESFETDKEIQLETTTEEKKELNSDSDDIKKKEGPLINTSGMKLNVNEK